MTTVALNLNPAARGQEIHWETCPACGCLFESTKKTTERSPNMKVTFDLTGTEPAKAAMFLRLAADFLAAPPIGAPEPEKTPAAPTGPSPKKGPAPKIDAAPAAEEAAEADDADGEDLFTLKPEEFKTKIRERCVALKKAGKRQAILDAYAALEVNHLDKVKPEDYPKLWEVLSRAG